MKYPQEFPLRVASFEIVEKGEHSAELKASICDAIERV